jgi:hypothetical protein
MLGNSRNNPQSKSPIKIQALFHFSIAKRADAGWPIQAVFGLSGEVYKRATIKWPLKETLTVCKNQIPCMLEAMLKHCAKHAEIL